MAITVKPVRIDVYDQSPGGPLNVDVHYKIASDNAEAQAMGAGSRGVVVKCECPRASIASLLAACKIVDDGGWPEGAVALPLPRK